MSYCLDYLNEESRREMAQHIDVDHKIGGSLSYCTVLAGTILPEKHIQGKMLGGVLDAERNYVELSAFHEGLGGGYDFDTVNRRKERVIYIGVLYGMWGHLLTDGLKKLWFLKHSTGIQLLEQGYRVVYITKGNKPLPAYCNDVFSLAGFDMRNWECISDVESFEEVIIPENSIVVEGKERKYSSEYADILETMKQNVLNENDTSMDSADRIYFTRSQLKSRREVGEKRIEREFEKKGYKIIAPEQCSVKQQIYYMLNCSRFATTEGSCSHNSMFGNKGTEVLIIRKADYVNSYQIMINELAGLNVTYIDANRTINAHPQSKWDGPFYLDTTDALRKYLETETVRIPYFLRIDYILYCVSVLLRVIKRNFLKILRR